MVYFDGSIGDGDVGISDEETHGDAHSLDDDDLSSSLGLGLVVTTTTTTTTSTSTMDNNSDNNNHYGNNNDNDNNINDDDVNRGGVVVGRRRQEDPEGHVVVGTTTEDENQQEQQHQQQPPVQQQQQQQQQHQQVQQRDHHHPWRQQQQQQVVNYVAPSSTKRINDVYDNLNLEDDDDDDDDEDVMDDIGSVDFSATRFVDNVLGGAGIPGGGDGGTNGYYNHHPYGAGRPHHQHPYLYRGNGVDVARMTTTTTTNGAAGNSSIGGPSGGSSSSATVVSAGGEGTVYSVGDDYSKKEDIDYNGGSALLHRGIQQYQQQREQADIAVGGQQRHQNYVDIEEQEEEEEDESGIGEGLWWEDGEVDGIIVDGHPIGGGRTRAYNDDDNTSQQRKRHYYRQQKYALWIILFGVVLSIMILIIVLLVSLIRRTNSSSSSDNDINNAIDNDFEGGGDVFGIDDVEDTDVPTPISTTTTPTPGPTTTVTTTTVTPTTATPSTLSPTIITTLSDIPSTMPSDQPSDQPTTTTSSSEQQQQQETGTITTTTTFVNMTMDEILLLVNNNNDDDDDGSNDDDDDDDDANDDLGIMSMLLNASETISSIMDLLPSTQSNGFFGDFGDGDFGDGDFGDGDFGDGDFGDGDFGDGDFGDGDFGFGDGSFSGDFRDGDLGDGTDFGDDDFDGFNSFDGGGFGDNDNDDQSSNNNITFFAIDDGVFKDIDLTGDVDSTTSSSTTTTSGSIIPRPWLLPRLLNDDGWELHLVEFLRYHVAAEYISLSDAASITEVTMSNGENITIIRNDNGNNDDTIGLISSSLTTTNTTTPITTTTTVDTVSTMTTLDGIIYKINGGMLYPSYFYMDLFDGLNQYSVFQSLIISANLESMFRGDDSDTAVCCYTLLAPNDDAFDLMIKDGKGDKLTYLRDPDNIEALQTTIKYHMIPDIIMSKQYMTTTSQQEYISAATLMNDNDNNDTNDNDNDANMNTTTNNMVLTMGILIDIMNNPNVFFDLTYVLEFDVIVNNGIIHTLERMLLPDGIIPDTIFEYIVEDNQLSIYDSFIIDDVNDIVELLDGSTASSTSTLTLTSTPPIVTLFAPTDDAFSNATITLEYINQLFQSGWIQHRYNFLEYHMVVDYTMMMNNTNDTNNSSGGGGSGGALHAIDLLDGTVLTMMNGETINISRTSEDVITLLPPSSSSSNDNDTDTTTPIISAADIDAINGIIHKIDNVLIPRFFYVDLYDILEEVQEHSIFLSLIVMVGNDDIILEIDNGNNNNDDSNSDVASSRTTTTTLESILRNGYSFTVLVPTNEAFQQRFGNRWFDYLNDNDNNDVVRDLIFFHLLIDIVPKRNMMMTTTTKPTPTAPISTTTSNNKREVYETALGSSDEKNDVTICGTFHYDDDSNDKYYYYYINDGTAKIVHFDHLAVNGIIHTIDNVLLPTTLSSGDEFPIMPLYNILKKEKNLSILYSLFTDVLGGVNAIMDPIVDLIGLLYDSNNIDNGNITMFAPTNRAFNINNANSNANNNNTTKAETIAKGIVDTEYLDLLTTNPGFIYHLHDFIACHFVVTQETLPYDSLLLFVSNNNITTYNGETIQVLVVNPGSGNGNGNNNNGRSADVVTLKTSSSADMSNDDDTPSIVTRDIFASNGIVHKIDGLLLPSYYYMDLYDVLIDSKKQEQILSSTFAELVVMVGSSDLEEQIRTNQYTILVPSNDAFDSLDDDNNNNNDATIVTLEYLRNPENSNELHQILLQHIIIDVITFSMFIQQQQEGATTDVDGGKHYTTAASLNNNNINSNSATTTIKVTKHNNGTTLRFQGIRRQNDDDSSSSSNSSTDGDGDEQQQEVTTSTTTTISTTADTTIINGGVDILAYNGIIHTIDNVLLF